MWIDILLILFSCVCANHLGLISAIEGVTRLRLPMINCPKCFSFWSTLAYCLVQHVNAIESIGIAFLIAYLALWLELSMGFIDTLYMIVYEKVYSKGYNNDTHTANGRNGHSKRTLSNLRKQSGWNSNKNTLN